MVFREIAGETVLVPVTGETQAAGRLFTLNGVGAFIWERIDGKRRLSDIVGEIMEEYEADQAAAESDLAELIKSLENIKAISSIS